MQQKQTQTDKQLQELIKVLDEKNKKEAIEQEEKEKMLTMAHLILF